MERVSVVFGGSILAPAQPQGDLLASTAQAIADWSRHRRLFIVVGGGHPARQYIQAARAIGVPEVDLDRIGIQATRLNAQSLAAALAHCGADVNRDIPLMTSDAVSLSERHRVVVMGGTVPGHSTDYVAVELAVKGGCARFVDATNVDGVYDRDPNRHADARLQPELSFEALLAIVGQKEWTAAGSPGVIDGPATVLLAANAIPTCVVHGRDLANVGDAVAGKAFRGTRVAGAKVVQP